MAPRVTLAEDEWGRWHLLDGDGWTLGICATRRHAVRVARAYLSDGVCYLPWRG